jgi:hypothetical protein
VVLALALGITIAAGSAAVGALPGLKGDRAAVAEAGTIGPAALESASMDSVSVPTPTPTRAPTPTVAKTPPVPDGSGSGRRIVFDQSDQRVWLVGGDESVERSYLVSGSRYDNLQPGSYAVQSRSRTAGAFDGTGTMEFFVRFVMGYTAPIGFHTVPVDNAGNLEQTREQLGTPLSAGCIRQWRPDAIALWDFAPIGTKVVVTA